MHGGERGGEQIGRAGQELARGRRPVEATVLVRE
jgi:hypothetical protein